MKQPDSKTGQRDDATRPTHPAPRERRLTTDERAALRRPETHLPTRGRARQGDTRHKAKQRSA